MSALDKAEDQFRGLLHTQPGLLRTLTIGLCGVLLVVLVLRPLAQQITATLRAPVLLTAGSPLPGAIGDGTNWPSSLTAGSADHLSTAHPKSSAQVIFDTVSDHIRKDPTQSTRLIETWISANDPPSNG